jgi:hypothetical protein
MEISTNEATQALQAIEASKLAMRRAIMASRGPAQLWVWGLAWMAMAIVRKLEYPRFWVTIVWISIIGSVISLTIGILQSGRIRGKIDKRFIAVCSSLLVFGYGIWPQFVAFKGFDSAFAYQMLVWMQLYIVGGIWFDTCLFWVGLLITALVLVGFVCFPTFFWLAAFLSGAVLLCSGFYIQRSWR